MLFSIYDSRLTIYALGFREHLGRFANVPRRRGDDGLGVDIDFFTLLNRLFNVIFTYKVYRRLSVSPHRGAVRRIGG